MTHTSSTVLCPFYKNDQEKSIVCEGVYSKCIILSFGKKAKKDEHVKYYCARNFKECEIYKILEKKYV